MSPPQFLIRKIIKRLFSSPREDLHQPFALFRGLQRRQKSPWSVTATSGPVSRQLSTIRRPVSANAATYLSTPLRLSRNNKTRIYHRFNSTKSSTPLKKKRASVSQRLRELSREYGWYAVGIYFALSILDFPFCFIAVRLFGTERIGHYERVVVEKAKTLYSRIWPFWKEKSADLDMEELAFVGNGDDGTQHPNSAEEASIWTQLALAYAVHKSLIVIRLPITAAVTPKIVQALRRWGWDIAKRKPKTR